MKRSMTSNSPASRFVTHIQMANGTSLAQNGPRPMGWLAGRSAADSSRSHTNAPAPDSTVAAA